MAKNNGVVKIMEGFKVTIFSEQNYNEQYVSVFKLLPFQNTTEKRIKLHCYMIKKHYKLPI